MHSAAQFTLSTVIVSAENVDGSTPAARVTWNTTVPPQCVASVRVEFRTSRSGPAVATYTTTNTSQTEVIQTGLQCATNYYITVVVTRATSNGVHVTASSSSVQVFVGGKEIVCIQECIYVVRLHHASSVHHLGMQNGRDFVLAPRTSRYIFELN